MSAISSSLAATAGALPSTASPASRTSGADGENWQSAYQSAIAAGGPAPAWTESLINELILQNGQRNTSLRPFSPVEIGILDKAGMLPGNLASATGFQQNMDTFDRLNGLGWNNLPVTSSFGRDSMGARFDVASLPNYDASRNTALASTSPAAGGPDIHPVYDASIGSGSAAPAWSESLVNELILQNGQRDASLHPYSPVEVGILDKAGMLPANLASAGDFKRNADTYDQLNGLGWSSLSGAGTYGRDLMGARFNVATLLSYDAERNTFGSVDAWT